MKAVETEELHSTSVSGVKRLGDTNADHIGAPATKRSRLAAAGDIAPHGDVSDDDAVEASEPQLLASECVLQSDIHVALKGAAAATAIALRSGRAVRLSDVLQMDTVLRRVVSKFEPERRPELTCSDRGLRSG
jgi:hypothetical protein